MLLIPRIFECLPQRIDRDSFLLALYMAAEAENPYFRLGYNSLGAFATINHLHFQVSTYETYFHFNIFLDNYFSYDSCQLVMKRKTNNSVGQAYYLAVPFPIERAPTKKITTLDGGVKISKLLNYPVRGLIFEGGNTIQDLSNTVSDACICLQDNNIPYNVLIADCGKRIFLFPQVICF